MGLVFAAAPAADLLTLDDALALAVAEDGSLESSKIDLMAALRRKQAKWAQFLPTISLTGGGSMEGSLLNPASPSLAANISIGASLTLDGTHSLDNKLLDVSYDSAQVSYDQVVFQLQTQVAQAYWTLVANKEMLESARNNVVLSEELYAETQKAYESGLATQLSVIQAQLDVRTAKDTLLENEESQTQALTSFYSLLGLEASRSFSLPDALEPQLLELSEADALVDTYVEQRADIRLLKLASNQASLTSAVEKKTAFSPTVSVSAGWTLDSSTSVTLADTASLSVAVSVPISGYISGSASNLKVKEAEDSYFQAEIALTTGIKTATSEITSQAAKMNRLWDAIDTKELSLALAQQVYDLSSDAYNAGTISLSELNETQQTLLESNQAFVEAKLAYILATYDLAGYLGIDVQELYETFGQSATQNETTLHEAVL